MNYELYKIRSQRKLTDEVMKYLEIYALKRMKPATKGGLIDELLQT